jgi:hypothetical protein
LKSHKEKRKKLKKKMKGLKKTDPQNTQNKIHQTNLIELEGEIDYC